MAEIILHIGLHKTATTTLQNQFFPACEGLNFILAHGRKAPNFLQQVNHVDAAYFDADACCNELSVHLEDREINLLSSESFSWVSWSGISAPGIDFRTQALQNISKTLPSAKIILVLRRQDSMVKSLYRQYLQAGGTRNIDRVFGSQRAQLKCIVPRNYFRYGPYVDKLKELFPAGVLVLPFERFRGDQAGFRAALCEFIGVVDPGVELTSSNTSQFGAFGLEFTRLLNHFFRSRLNPAGLLPGYPVTRDGSRTLITPSHWLHDKWPIRGALTEKAGISRRGKEIFDEMKEDNQRLDERYRLGLKDWGYY